VTIDAERNHIEIGVSDEALATRKRQWQMPAYKANRGTLAKYIRLVKSASLGCVTDE
jgi:dihydroxy-acid dehydratase